MARKSLLLLVLLFSIFLFVGMTACGDDDDDEDATYDDDDSSPVDDDDDSGDDDTADDDDDDSTDDDDDTSDDDDDTGDDDDDDDDDTVHEVTITKPQEGSSFKDTQVEVEVAFLGSPDSHQVLIDGGDVTAQVPLTGPNLAYGFVTNLPPGEHTLVAKGTWGKEILEDSVDFTLTQDAYLDLTLSNYAPSVGSPVTPDPHVYDELGNDVTDQVSIDYDISPGTGWFWSGNDLVFTTPTLFEVTASSEWNATPIDDMKQVTASGYGDVESVTIDCSPNTIAAGETTTCVAIVEDEYGNVIPDAIVTYSATPSQGVTINDNELTMTLATTVTVTGTVDGTAISDTDDVLVNPGDPVSLNLFLSPQFLPVEDTSTATVVMLDAYGNNSDATWDIDVAAEAEAIISGSDITPMRAGNFLVTASVVSPPLSDSKTLFVDDPYAPEIIITTPERGTFRTVTPLTIEGYVFEPHSELDYIRINDVDISINPDTGFFTETYVLNLGINPYAVTAKDTYNNISTATVATMYAPNFISNGNVVTYAAGARINQGGLNTVEEIAEELIMDFAGDIMDYIDNPIFNESYEIYGIEIYSASGYITNISFGQINIEIVPITGGLRITASVPNLDVDGYVNWSIFKDQPQKATSNFELTCTSAVVSMDVAVAANGGNLDVSLLSTSVNLYGFNVEISGGIIEELLNWILSLFESMVVDVIEDLVEDYIADYVPPIIEDALNDLDLSFDFDFLGFSYDMAALFSYINFTTTGGEIYMGADVSYGGAWTPGPNAPDAPGSLYTPSSRPTLGPYIPGTSVPYDFGVAISDDILNQALHVATRSGLISLDLDQQTLEDLGIDDFELDTTALAIFMPQLPVTYGADKPVIIKLRPLLAPVIVLDPAKSVDSALQMGDFVLEWWCEYSPGQEELFAEVALNFSADVEILINPVNQTINLNFGDINMDADLFNEPVFDIADLFIEALLPVLVENLLPTLLGVLLEEIPIPSFEGYTINVISFQVVGGLNDWMGLFGSLVEADEAYAME